MYCFSHPLCSNCYLRVGEKSHWNCMEGNLNFRRLLNSNLTISISLNPRIVKVTERSAEESLLRNV